MPAYEHIKTTHIVIHDQSLEDDGEPISPTTPIPPLPPATQLSRDRDFVYQWDDSVHTSYIPVRCKNSNGILFKNKFGSGELYVKVCYEGEVQPYRKTDYEPMII